MRVLLVVHGFPPAASGGTETYVHDLARGLGALPDTEVLVLTRDADPQRPEMAVRQHAIDAARVFSINNTFQSCTSFPDSYRNKRLLDVACSLIDSLQPDVAHVQHLTCLSTDLPRELARRRIPVVLTLNDYWLICHRGQLFDLDNQRCAGPFDGGCGRCIPPAAIVGPGSYSAGRFVRHLPLPGAARAIGYAAGALDRIKRPAGTRSSTLARLADMQETVRHVDRVLAPSATMAEWFTRFGVPRERLVRCNQGISLSGFDPARRQASAALRIAFAGGLLPSKAPHVLLDAIDRLPGEPIVVDLLGTDGPYHGHDDYAASIAHRLGHPAIRRLGPVPHERMPAALTDVDVVVVPSVWIENAPFIIREAFAAGAPVVASDLGGMAEMVRHEVDGLRFPPGDAVALSECLRRLLHEPDLLDRLRAGIVRPLSIEDDAANLRALYEELTVRRRDRTTRGERQGTSALPTVAAVVLNYRTPEQTWLAVRSLQTSFTSPKHIIVVDNGSNDGSADTLRATLERVRVVETGANLGFSGGVNAGIRTALAAGCDSVLLVNSDVVLAPDAIGRLLERMKADASVGIAGPLLLSREEPGRIASAGIDYSRVTGRMRQRGAGAKVASLAGRSEAVDAVSGCVMLVRRSVFEQVGLFDEQYFFSFEDIDFCLRAARQGFQSACVLESVAYHEGGKTIGRRSARRVYFATRNHLRLQSLVGHPGRRAVGAAAIMALSAAYVTLSPEAPFVAGFAAIARGAWHHLRGQYGADG
jgi:GT2 family glycosyltransferase/glycosyltransferase involved in cell wall biosynthesis